MSSVVRSRPVLRHLLSVGVAVSGLALAACSTPAAGTATAASAASAATTSSSSTSTSTSAAAPGTASGSVADIRVFADPATEIETAEDFAAYLLPGMSGAGVDCATAELEPEPVLNQDLEGGASTVSDLLVRCIEPTGIGELMAIYAVGFADGGAELYPDLAACAADAFDGASAAEIDGYLRDIYEARLDLAGPPSSRDIAAAILADDLGCFAVPVTTSETEAPSSDTPSPSAASAGERAVDWTLLQAGDCIPTLPPDGQNSVLVGDCATPHEAEVIGHTLAIAGTEESSCVGFFESYVGSPFDATPSLDLTYYTSTDTFSDPTLVCLVHSADGTLLTGSVRAA